VSGLAVLLVRCALGVDRMTDDVRQDADVAAIQHALDRADAEINSHRGKPIGKKAAKALTADLEFVARRVTALRAQLAAQEQEIARLTVVISKRFDDDNKPVSFASLMDGIDSRHVQDCVYDIVIWHIRRADAAESARDAAHAEVARLKEFIVSDGRRFAALAGPPEGQP